MQCSRICTVTRYLYFLFVMSKDHAHGFPGSTSFTKRNFSPTTPLHQKGKHLNIKSHQAYSLGLTPRSSSSVAFSDKRELGQLTTENSKSTPSSLCKPKGLSVPATVINIFNNVAGSGILTLAYGMGLGVGWIPAMAANFILAALSGWTFFLIGASCDNVGATTFRELWNKTLGSNTAWVVDACIALMCFFSTVIYSSILGDLFSSLLQLALATAPGNIAFTTTLADASWLRSATILTTTASTLAPLCLVLCQ
jgi:hypothetical protein